MIIKMIRRYKSDFSVISKFKLYIDENLVYECFALEELESGILKAPAGEYKLNSYGFKTSLKEFFGFKNKEVISFFNKDLKAKLVFVLKDENLKTNAQIITLGETKKDNKSLEGSQRAFENFCSLVKDKDLKFISLEVVDEL